MRCTNIGYPEYFLKSALKKYVPQVYCMCDHGNFCIINTRFVASTFIICTSCYNLKGDIGINPKIKQSTIIEAMGIPSNIPNALELAEAHLESLKKKEQTLKRIEEIIDAE